MDSDDETWPIMNVKLDLGSDPEAAYPEEIKSTIRNNQPPSKTALGSAMAFREEPATIVSELDAKLGALDVQMKELETQKNALEKEAKPHRRRLKACDTVLAPIRRVPFDIIREIARLTLPAHPSATTKLSPLSLCQVSSAWRRAALSLPKLWKTLYVVLEDVLAFNRYARRVVQWLERANGQPCTLYLHFHFPSPHEEIAKSAHSIFLRSIRPSITSVRHLGISSIRIANALPCFEKAEWTLEGLETLEINSSISSDLDWVINDHQPDPDVVMPPMGLFKTATNLCSVTIENDFVRMLGARTLLPWPQLTTIVLTEWLRADDWAELMESCPQMQRGHFRVAVEWLLERPKRTFAHLEELRLCVMYSSLSVICLVNTYDLPKLRVLDLEHDIDYDNEVPDPPHAKDTPAFKTIETLYFDDVWQETKPLYVLEMLTELTNLREVELTDVVPGDTYQSLFKAMLFTQPVPILPRLSNLFVSATNKVTDWVAFAEMVRSRCFDLPPDHQSLKELKVIISQNFRARERKVIPAIAQLKDALKSCEDAGLSMKIGDNYDYILRKGHLSICMLKGWQPWIAIEKKEYEAENASWSY